MDKMVKQTSVSNNRCHSVSEVNSDFPAAEKSTGKSHNNLTHEIMASHEFGEIAEDIRSETS